VGEQATVPAPDRDGSEYPTNHSLRPPTPRGLLQQGIAFRRIALYNEDFPDQNSATMQQEEEIMDLESFVKEKITWLGHASFRIDGSKATVYIDPWKLRSTKPADVVCITHNHFDHLSEEDVAKIRTPKTVIVGPPDCAANFGNAFKKILPNEKVTVDDVSIEAVPAYNVDKDFHPKKNNWVGFIVTVDGVRIYHIGDSDAIPEMTYFQTDVVLVPVGGTYTMTVEQAAEAVNAMKTKVAVPMHCGDIVGTLDDRAKFKSLVNVPVIILNPTDR
jgi:L-ascorbate metabolism protein UlaG (beta-lactamase superfamily)